MRSWLPLGLMMLLMVSPAWAEGGRPPLSEETKSLILEAFPDTIVDREGCDKVRGMWQAQGHSELCFVRGEAVGVQMNYEPTGVLRSVIGRQGKLFHGPSLSFYPSGALRERGQYVDGQREGRFYGYREDGTLGFEQELKAGKKSGVWRTYMPSGHLETEANFVDDALEGPTVSFYPSCHKSEEGSYEAGKKSGHWREWNSEGILISEGPYVDNVQHGEWKHYHPMLRVLLEEGSYEEGQREGEWREYFTNGHLFRTVTYVAGVRQGVEGEAACEAAGHIWMLDHHMRMEGCQADPFGEHRTGVWRAYSETGGVVWEATFNESGAQEGVERHWDPEGALYHEGVWQGGVPEGLHRWGYEGQEAFGESVILEGTGDWKAFYHDGSPREEGVYHQGKREGLWSFWLESGVKEKEETYVGGLRNGPMREWFVNGQLKVEGYYANEMMRVGVWTAYWYSGSIVWQGEYNEQGERVGIWRSFYADGILKEEGSLVADERVGLWTEYYDNGIKSGEGSYIADAKEGIWRFWWKDGSFWREAVFEGGAEVGTDTEACLQAGGEWVSVPEARSLGCQMCQWTPGTEVTLGETEEGEVTPGEVQVLAETQGLGRTRLTDVPEDEHTGKIVKRAEAIWTFWHANGQKEQQGRFMNGVREGKWTFWYPNGDKMLEGPFRAGQESGFWRGWYRGGAKRFEGRFVEGKEEGDWTLYWMGGDVQAKGTYSEGKKSGVWEYHHEAGGKHEEGAFDAGKEEGVWKSYYPSGALRGEGAYEGGKRVGEWRWWREDGTLWRKATYQDGKEVRVPGG